MKSEERKRILVLRYRFIGDTILTVPFLRNLRRAEPEAYICWVVAPGSSDVVQGIPYVDELKYWDPVTIHADSRGAHRTLADKWAFIKELRAKRYDKVYVLKRSLSSAIIARLTGAPQRIGFNTEGRGFLLTKKVPYNHDQHEVQNFLDVLRADDIAVTDDYLETWVTPDETREAERLLDAAGVRSTDQIVAIHTFASISGKSWPLEDFAAVASRLYADYGYLPMILGGPRDAAEFTRRRALFPDKTVDLVGKCGLRVTMAALKKCTFFVGNDSGIMHLAAAAGIPVIALFGPTSPQRFGPWGRNTRVIYSSFPCSPCRMKFFQECKPSNRSLPECMEAITVAKVMEEIGRLGDLLHVR